MLHSFSFCLQIFLFLCALRQGYSLFFCTTFLHSSICLGYDNPVQLFNKKIKWILVGNHSSSFSFFFPPCDIKSCLKLFICFAHIIHHSFIASPAVFPHRCAGGMERMLLSWSALCLQLLLSCSPLVSTEEVQLQGSLKAETWLWCISFCFSPRTCDMSFPRDSLSADCLASATYTNLSSVFL